MKIGLEVRWGLNGNISQAQKNSSNFGGVFPKNRKFGALGNGPPQGYQKASFFY